MKKQYTAEEIRRRIEKVLKDKGREPASATAQQFYDATCLTVRDIMSELWLKNHDPKDSHMHKQVYYLSMEFLPGPSLHNNVFNLGLEGVVQEALKIHGYNLSDFYAMDPDAGLGNGGLGRLASCYLDAIASQKMPGHGFSICYEYGIFKQKIEDCKQTEKPDAWMEAGGDCWLVKKPIETEKVHFGGELEEIWDETGKLKLIHKNYKTVLAVPYDMLITGYHSDVVNTLRLWRSKSPISIDMELFGEGKYLQAMEEKHRAEVISKILYPEDAHKEGKELRITQQYFFISASMQLLLRTHFKRYGTLDNFFEKVAVHINDTHPTMAIPELMRIMLDEYGYQWEDAWSIVAKTVSYTNHTIMPEALEKWPEDLYASILPRLHSIVMEISRRFDEQLFKTFPYQEAIRKEMAIIRDGTLRMANLCVAASHKVNGVSALHSGIIRDRLFNGFYQMTPDKFTNVTNGIAYRRWLCQANPSLSELIEELCGPGFKTDAGELEKLTAYAGDAQVLQRLEEIKLENKKRLAKYIKDNNDIIVNPNSIFDVQVKRLHEYKRQLLNLFHIIDLYNRIKENPNMEREPQTFIFGAKSAAGYYMAKQIISLACNLSQEIENDPIARAYIKLVFLENYSVSLSELIMPAAEVSEQISLAGKEASGTGNMKLMINGAVTLGTEDGANVEIHQVVGDDNIFIFGMKVDEVETLRQSGTYRPWSLCHNNSSLEKIVQRLLSGVNGVTFGDIVNSLTTGQNGEGDQYFILADFEDYKRAQQDMQTAYKDRERWNRMSLMNIAKSGLFSADRAVIEYADRIWGIKPIHV